MPLPSSGFRQDSVPAISARQSAVVELPRIWKMKSPGSDAPAVCPAVHAAVRFSAIAANVESPKRASR
ncbi:MAG: hypothetical protein ACRDLY_04180 [Thermoleophilaceae bacterium]